MTHDFPESDWRAFSELRKVALEHFCARVLEEIEAASSDASRSYHERYLTVYRLLQKRDEQLAIAFNDPRRSGMMIQLVALHMYGLLQPEELARFTPQDAYQYRIGRGGSKKSSRAREASQGPDGKRVVSAPRRFHTDAPVSW